MLGKLVRSAGFQRFLGRLGAGYLRLVYRSCRVVYDPPDAWERLRAPSPFIIALWHGQHFMPPFGKAPWWTVKAMVSRSGDGEVQSALLESLGLENIRASGGLKGRSASSVKRRGGVYGVVAAVAELKDGNFIAMTADVPRGVPREPGEGIVAIARHSGRPIVAVAGVTSRHVHLNTWDRSVVNLPFGRYVWAAGEPIYVDKDAGPDEIEAARRRVKAELDRVHARAYAIAAGRDPDLAEAAAARDGHG